jgi:hypothetical protein
VGKDPEGERKLGVEAGEEGPVVLLERVLDLLDDHLAQVKLFCKISGLWEIADKVF